MENLKPTVEKEVQIPKLPDDEKVTKGHPPKATVEKELELEPVKSQDKELERESPKKRTKSWNLLSKQQSSKEDLLLEEIKNEMDQNCKKVTQTANYIRTLVDNSKHNRGVAETRLKTYSDIPELKNWLDQIVELDQKIDELSKKELEEAAKKGATITQQQEKVLEKEIPQEPHLKETGAGKRAAGYPV
ncbi:hypothetical protein niasHT_031153 [Heterodera trifolii]|uniref:Uncharacterized protein n=1 Tax=Heterodera trifolii TaxID=157864 RepID=A0ABD2I5T5_9BILA